MNYSSPVKTLIDSDALCFLVAPDDYTAITLTISLDSDTISTRPIMIPIHDDDFDEPDESFEIMLTSLNDNCAVSRSTIPVLIIDNDGELPTHYALSHYMFDAYCMRVLQFQMLALTRPVTQ